MPVKSNKNIEKQPFMFEGNNANPQRVSFEEAQKKAKKGFTFLKAKKKKNQGFQFFPASF